MEGTRIVLAIIFGTLAAIICIVAIIVISQQIIYGFLQIQDIHNEYKISKIRAKEWEEEYKKRVKEGKILGTDRR